MDNKQLRWQIIDAKRAHRRWVGNAHLLIEGVSMDADMVPANETECGFGEWFFTDGQQFSDNPLFREIGAYHQQLHEKYHEIVSILFEEEAKPSFLQRLIGRSATTTESQRERAREKYTELNSISHQMVQLLDQFLAQIEHPEAIVLRSRAS